MKLREFFVLCDKLYELGYKRVIRIEKQHLRMIPWDNEVELGGVLKLSLEGQPGIPVYTIERVIGLPNKAKEPDWQYYNPEIREFAKTIVSVGSWHSHPDNDSRPSKTDVRFAKNHPNDFLIHTISTERYVTFYHVEKFVLWIGTKFYIPIEVTYLRDQEVTWFELKVDKHDVCIWDFSAVVDIGRVKC